MDTVLMDPGDGDFVNGGAGAAASIGIDQISHSFHPTGHRT